MPTGSQQLQVHRRNHLFSKVKEARELLKAEAENILKMYMQVIQEARAKGDLETAQKALQWLIEHLPEDEGVRMVDISVDKPKEIEGNLGPSIQIGIALGGMNAPPPLPQATTTVIDVTPEHDDTTDP